MANWILPTFTSTYYHRKRIKEPKVVINVISRIYKASVNNAISYYLQTLYKRGNNIQGVVFLFGVLVTWVSHLFHPQEQSHPCRFESRCCPQTVCPSWSAYTPHTPYKEKNTKQAISSFQIASWPPNMTTLCADSLLHGAGIRARGALVTCGPVGTRLGALAGPAHTLAPPAAQQAQVGHTGVSTSGAVTVLTLPVWCTLAEATVTDAMAWKRKEDIGGEKTTIYNLNTQFPPVNHLLSRLKIRFQIFSPHHICWYSGKRVFIVVLHWKIHNHIHIPSAMCDIISTHFHIVHPKIFVIFIALGIFALNLESSNACLGSAFFHNMSLWWQTHQNV